MQFCNYNSGGKGLASNGILPPSDALKTANCSHVDSFQHHSLGDFVNTFSLETDSTSRHSCSAVDSNSRACNSIVDLKLGRFGDPAETQNSRSVVSPSKPAKRVRLGVNLQITRCQVYGCNKDLSSCKEYHRRHKVCEVHSKTPKVIVNGIEQRFCQQCSRFHLLNEFDDGKRSCRKRLAGHNERRRKPQVGLHSGRSGRLLQSYNGFGTSKYNKTSLASFVCLDILPNVPLNLEKSGANNWYRHIKVENGSNFALPSSVPSTDGHLEKAFLGFSASTPTGTFFNESSNQYGCDLTGSNTSLGNEAFNAFVPSSTIGSVPGITNPGCALSLLSSQSQNFSGLGISAGSSNHYSVGQVSEKLPGVSSTSGMAHKFSSSGTSSVEGSNIQFGSALVSNGGDVISFDGSNFMNVKDCVSGEDDSTIDLLQLSSQLQRVEWQKQSMQVKQETDALYWHHIA